MDLPAPSGSNHQHNKNPRLRLFKKIVPFGGSLAIATFKSTRFPLLICRNKGVRGAERKFLQSAISTPSGGGAGWARPRSALLLALGAASSFWSFRQIGKAA